ncbi:MAG: hypothetical protein KAX65_13930, partial [Caldilineaceae bacterium]|nr:hypothetical protein [Caldilineaceae bacterium]
MTAPRSPRSIRRLDLSKYGVLLLLAVLASVLLVTRSCQEQFEKIAGAPTATVVPTFTAEAAIAAPVLISPLTGEQVAAGTVVLSGSAQPGYTVQARIDGELAGEVPVDSSGVWLLAAPVTAPGDRALDLQLVDDIGRVVASSTPITIMVTMPAVTVRSPALDSRMLESSFNAGVIDLAGSGEPGALVQIVVDGQVLGATRVDDDGRWSLQAEVRTPGVYAVALNALDDNGTVVATATPARLTVNPALRPLAVVAPTATATPEPASTAAPPQLEGVTVGAATDGARVTLRGRAAPGALVQVATDNSDAQTVTADADGIWTAAITAPAAGDYVFHIAAVDDTGAVIAAAAPITVSVLPTPAPTATAATILATPTGLPGT